MSWGLGCQDQTQPGARGSHCVYHTWLQGSLVPWWHTQIVTSASLIPRQETEARSRQSWRPVLGFPARSRCFFQVHRSQAAMVDRVPWECSRGVCWLQVSVKTSMLVTKQMLFTFPKWREVWGRPSVHRGGEAHAPHHRADLLCVVGMWQQRNPVGPEKLLIIGEGKQDKGAAHGFVVQKRPDDL